MRKLFISMLLLCTTSAMAEDSKNDWVNTTIGWSASLDSFKIEQASNLVPPVLWFQSGIPISSNSGRFSATLTNSGADRFFRLVPK